MFLYGLFAAVLTGLVRGQAPVNCGRSCLLPCRSIAIKCVQNGVSPSKFTELMQCVIKNTQDENYKKDNPTHDTATCWECIEPQLEELTVEQKKICLEEGLVDTCSNNDRDACHQLFFTQKCGFIGGKCRTMADGGMTYVTYEQVIADIVEEDECIKLGGKWRDGSCVPRDEDKVKCGKINKSHQKKCRECEDLCFWLPKCKYKSKKNRCSAGPRPFLLD